MGKTHTKRKVLAHIIDNEAIQILSSVLPTHWTVRPYVPDYGIDLSIEMFKPIADADGIKKYDTLGEHLFAQVKGTQSITKRTICVSQRYNVEKLPLEQTSQLLSSDKPLPCEIIDFRIDTSELLTIQRMGAAVPVALFVVDTTSHQVFFLCLNDYIDKVILPDDPSEYDDPGESYSVEEWLCFTQLRCLWSDLANLGRVYEETCREWYLPTWFGIGCIQ